MNLQLFAGPGDEVTDTELFLNLYDVEDPLDEFGEPIPEGEKQEDKPEGEGQQEQAPAQEETPAQEQAPQQEQKPQEQTPEKKVQTPEENARFAEMRRQKEAQERAERLAQERLQQSPEYRVAQLLAQQYGMTTEQLLAKMQEAVLQRQAQQSGVPVEVLKQIEAERRARAELEMRLNQTEFQNWMTQKQNEMASLKTKYPGVLTDEDLNQAMVYQLETLKNVNLPLENAVYALHGPKIAAHLQKIAKQEALAEISGRKQGPLPPQGAKSAPADFGLTAEEKYVARKMGLTEAEYAKYKAES